MRFVYISQGNIPSRWAHSVQAMKMAEAFAVLVPDFRLVTQAHWTDLLRPRFDFEGWYGIRRPFPIVRLPAFRRSASVLAETVFDRRYDRLASWYALRLRADCVFTRSPNAGLRCVRHGLPTVIETHSSGSDPATELTRRASDDPQLRAVVTVSEALKQAYVRAGISESKVLVWPDAVDPAQFAVAAGKSELRRQLGLPQERPVVAYVGHFYAHKGVDTVVEAAALVPEADFVLIGGWAEDIARMRTRVEGLRNVQLRGYVPNAEVPKYLCAADVLLLPNSAGYPQAHTTSPLKLFEYMASRRPIVATDIPALRGLVRQESNAIVVPADSPQSMANAVRRVAGDTALAARLADAAWNDVQSCTWSRRAQAVLDFVGARPAH